MAEASLEEELLALDLTDDLDDYDLIQEHNEEALIEISDDRFEH